MEKSKSKEDLVKTSSESLAAQIVVYRSLGLNKKLAIACMQELSARRKAGDTFEYEKFIEEELKKIPKSNSMDLTKITKDIQSQTGLLDVRRIINTFNKKDHS